MTIWEDHSPCPQDHCDEGISAGPDAASMEGAISKFIEGLEGMAEVMEQLDAERDELLDDDDKRIRLVKDVKEVEKRLRHRLPIPNTLPLRGSCREYGGQGPSYPIVSGW